MDGSMGRERRAAASAGRANVGKPEPWDGIYNKALALMERRLYAEAEPFLRRALEQHPDSADILNSLGSSLWEQGFPAQSEPFSRAPAS